MSDNNLSFFSLKKLMGLFLLLSILSSHSFALEPLGDESLAAVIGGDGVQMIFRLHNNVDAAGQPDGCTGGFNPCRMGLEFSGREGIWLMLKDYYGILSINDIYLESAALPSNWTLYKDEDRFLGGDGNCLITGCDPRGGQAVRITYPSYKAIGEYKDFSLLLNIGRTALEFDAGSTPGYMLNNATGSALGFRMADSSALNAPSAARFDGAAYVFGF